MGSAYARPLALLALIMALALALRLVCYVGFVGSDDDAYASLASSMASGAFEVGRYQGPPVYALRVGLLAPVAFMFKVFGVSEHALITYPFALSLLSVALAFVAGRAFFGEAAGLTAAALQAVLPLDAAFASQLQSDLPSNFWLTLGVVLLYFGSHDARRASQIWYGLASGLAFGVSWLNRESLVYLIPFLTVYLGWRVLREPRYLMLVVGLGIPFLGAVATESLFYDVRTGDLLYRLHATERNYEITRMGFFTEGSPFGWQHGRYWTTVLKRTLFEGPAAILLDSQLGGVTFVALVGTAYAAIRRERRLLFAATWFVTLVLFFNFGSSSLLAYRPLPLVAVRYLYPLVFPAILVTAGLLDSLVRSPEAHGELCRERRFWAGVLVALIACGCAVGLARTLWVGRGSPVERQVAALLRPDAPLLTDHRTAGVLRFFWKYPQAMGTCDFTGMRVRDVPGDAYVLINPDRLDLLRGAYGYKPPEFYQNVPPNWVLVWRGPRAVLYLVSSEAANHGVVPRAPGAHRADTSLLNWSAPLCKTAGRVTPALKRSSASTGRCAERVPS